MMNNVRGHHNSCRLNTEYPRFSSLDSKTISARMVIGIRMAVGMAVLYQQVVYPFPVWNEKTTTRNITQQNWLGLWRTYLSSQSSRIFTRIPHLCGKRQQQAGCCGRHLDKNQNEKHQQEWCRTIAIVGRMGFRAYAVCTASVIVWGPDDS